MSPSSVSRSRYKLLVQLVILSVCSLGFAQRQSAATGCNTANFNSALTFAAGPNPGSSATADLNGDGSLDLVVTNSAVDTFSILFGDGAGGFGPPLTYAVGIKDNPGAYPNAVAIGDMNADGKCLNTSDICGAIRTTCRTPITRDMSSG